MLERLHLNYEMSISALTHSMGYSWDTRIEPSQKDLQHRALNAVLPDLISDTYTFSPDWQKMSAALDIAEAAVTEAKSHHRPKLALTGKLQATENDLTVGLPVMTISNIGQSDSASKSHSLMDS